MIAWIDLTGLLPKDALLHDPEPECAVAGPHHLHRLLVYADILLVQWKRVRDGTLTRRGFRQSYLGWLREEQEPERNVGRGGEVLELQEGEQHLVGRALVFGLNKEIAGIEIFERAATQMVGWRRDDCGNSVG